METLQHVHQKTGRYIADTITDALNLSLAVGVYWRQYADTARSFAKLAAKELFHDKASGYLASADSVLMLAIADLEREIKLEERVGYPDVLNELYTAYECLTHARDKLERYWAYDYAA